MKRFFYDWVPPQLDIWILVFFNITFAFTNGIPTTIAGYVIGSQSAIPADINMAGFASLLGMASFFPFALRVVQFINSKLILCGAYLVMIFLNFILSETDQPLIMVMASFVIGGIKIISALVLILQLIPVLMPKGERYQLYSVFYPLSLIFAPVSGLIAAYISNYFNWKYSFHEQNLLLFAGLVATVLLVHSPLAAKRVPLYQYDWIGTILFCTGLLLLCYVFCYGLTEDWLHSIKIQSAIAGALVAFTIFLQRSLRIKRPLLRSGAFKQWKPIAGLTVIFLLCLFANTSALLSPFLNIILKNNPLESAKINTYGLPGVAAGSALCFIYYRKFTNFKAMAVIACMLFLVSNVMMFQFTSSFTGPADLFLPMSLRGMATVISYISVGLYITSNMPFFYLNDMLVVIVGIRLFIAPIVSSTIYSYGLYRGQINYINRLANKMDQLGPFVSRNAALFSRVRSQASLLAIRDIYGLLIVAGAVMLVIVVVFPFHGSAKRVIFNWKNPLYGEEAAQSIPS